MKTELPVKEEPFRIELLRDKLFVVRRGGGDPAALRNAIGRLNRNLKKLPRGSVDTVAEVRAIRDSGGRD